jgi:hypothetical protein
MGEAARRLPIMQEAGRVNVKLKEKHPNQFAGLYIEHTPKFRIVVKMTGAGQGLLKGITDDPLYEVVKADRPVKQSMQLQDRMLNVLNQAGIRSEIDIDIRSERILVQVLDAASARTTLADFIAKHPYVDVVQVPELMTNTATTYGGKDIKYSPLDAGHICTTGFPAIVGGVSGHVTTAHCSTTPTGYMYVQDNKYTIAAYKYENSTTQGLDMMFLSRAGDTVPNEIYVTSTARIAITSAAPSNPAGNPVCVFGLTTKKKICGSITQEYAGTSDNNKVIGYFGKAASTGGVTFGQQGDSGGPVYSGNMAVGLIKSAAGSTLYFVNVKDLSAIRATIKTAR